MFTNCVSENSARNVVTCLPSNKRVVSNPNFKDNQLPFSFRNLNSSISQDLIASIAASNYSGNNQEVSKQIKSVASKQGKIEILPSSSSFLNKQEAEIVKNLQISSYSHNSEINSKSNTSINCGALKQQFQIADRAKKLSVTSRNNNQINFLSNNSCALNTNKVNQSGSKTDGSKNSHSNFDKEIISTYPKGIIRLSVSPESDILNHIAVKPPSIKKAPRQCFSPRLNKQNLNNNNNSNSTINKEETMLISQHASETPLMSWIDCMNNPTSDHYKSRTQPHPVLQQLHTQQQISSSHTRMIHNKTNTNFHHKKKFQFSTSINNNSNNNNSNINTGNNGNGNIPHNVTSVMNASNNQTNLVLNNSSCVLNTHTTAPPNAAVTNQTALNPSSASNSKLVDFSSGAAAATHLLPPNDPNDGSMWTDFMRTEQQPYTPYFYYTSDNDASVVSSTSPHPSSMPYTLGRTWNELDHTSADHARKHYEANLAVVNGQSTTLSNNNNTNGGSGDREVAFSTTAANPSNLGGGAAAGLNTKLAAPTMPITTPSNKSVILPKYTWEHVNPPQLLMHHQFSLPTTAPNTSSTPATVAPGKSSILSVTSLPRHKTHNGPQIMNVWSHNLEEEFAKIRDIVEHFQYVAIDTEFPGIVVLPAEQTSDYHYQTIKLNVDRLKIIQLGITFADEHGCTPCGTSTWQFNFKFDINTDMYAEDSIDVLKASGIDFATCEKDGIDIHEFGEIIMSSGLVMSSNVKWISFHGSYDFGYLLKLLTCAPLPDSENQFFDLLKDFFPALYDIKYLLQNCSKFDSRVSLQRIAKHLDVERVGQQHQAGSDSLVTCHTFFRLMNKYFNNLLDDSIYSGVIYGLGETVNNDVEILNYRSTRCLQLHDKQKNNSIRYQTVIASTTANNLIQYKSSLYNN